MIDFDEIDDWFFGLSAALDASASPIARRAVEDARPKSIQDARDILLRVANRDAVIDATLDWLYSETVVAYHGTRLTDVEVVSVQSDGLLPLVAKSRSHRLRRALSSHPNWADVEHRLEAEIEALGNGKAGNRVQQVHLSISRAGLISFDSYHRHGSEFDYHAAYALLGSDGQALLVGDGKSCIVRVALPGTQAANAANPFFSINNCRKRGDIPALADEFLKAWSFKLAHNNFQSRTLERDCCLFFRTKIAAEYIVAIEYVDK